MATSQNQRLRRMAEKTARRKAVVADKLKADKALATDRDTRQVLEASRAPVLTCFMPQNLFDDGIGWIVLARRLPSGMVGTSFFLVDTRCLGIKNAFFNIDTMQEFTARMKAANEDPSNVKVDPSVARKLLHDAVVYAKSLGFDPCENHAKAEAIFGDIPMATDSFTFGKDGKPFYVSGPNDTPSRMRQIIDTLVKSVGKDGFDFLAAVKAFS